MFSGLMTHTTEAWPFLQPANKKWVESDPCSIRWSVAGENMSVVYMRKHYFCIQNKG